jgi:glutamate dehydrogenase
MAAAQNAVSRKTNSQTNKKLLKPLMQAFLANALPGENEGFNDAACAQAATFALVLAATRKPGNAAIAIDSFEDGDGRMAMRVAICNDDMPFLVDSVAGAISAAGLKVQRLIHPVLTVKRDGSGSISSISAERGAREHRESFIYLESSRVDAKERRALETSLKAVLHEVRCAVQDWEKMQAAMAKDSATITDEKGAELLRWFGSGNMTILGHETLMRGSKRTQRLGIARANDLPLLSEASMELAFRWFEKGGSVPLILKANRMSRVHRNTLLDLLLVPQYSGKKITGFSITAGLWTSEALSSKPENVPVLRDHMASLMTKFGFDPSGHAGKAMAHVLTNLPHDLLVSLVPDDLERLALTAMSLNDRPRPKLLAMRSPLGRHLFVIVWLPRDEVSTAMRQAITNMLTSEAKANLLGWSIVLEDSGLATLRFTLDLPDRTSKIDETVLDKKLQLMVRGWEPAVEAALAQALDEKRASALMTRYSAAFPANYRSVYSTEEAALDIQGLLAMERDHSRISRFYVPANATGSQPGNALGLKVYNRGGAMPLSDIVPALENFGFDVIEESPTALSGELPAYIHDFKLRLRGNHTAKIVMERAEILQTALSAVLDGKAENDVFNQLIVVAQIEPQAAVWLRAWFRYLRQTGLSYGMINVADALGKNPQITQTIIALFAVLHDPKMSGNRQKDADRLVKAIDAGLADVAAIDEDRVLRLFRAVVLATLRTNAYVPAASQALAFKLDSAAVPGLPKPLPWREIWVYSPQVEGIHLRAGPIARGGLRWSDRRDDFRTEVLGLMKAQRVKNAVIVPTGAKGGFYPKRLPDAAIDRDAWLAEGTESYRVFIRSLLSVTDNIVNGKIVPPAGIVVRDGDDPYFVVAADKGTATFSDTANAIAIEHNFWLGDAFASGGSVGYDHKAMGITAKGAWISVQRHFAEMGVDIQNEPVTVAGVGDMSGDVFGNGLLLSQSIKLVAAFDHRHIFIDPNPDPAASWQERSRLFVLPRSSWQDYNPALISKGGGVFSRREKSITLSPEICALLNLERNIMEPAELIRAILKSNAELIWFGGIGTYIKDDSQSNSEVGDHANDAIRINASELRTKVIGEGANLGVTQAGRIGFAMRGGRINTDFIDNSAGVDCSDNEVNIKIALNTQMASGKLTNPVRVKLLASMTDAVAKLVLEDNRLQTLALSVAETGGAGDLPAYVRLIETFEATGKLDRAVEGIANNEVLLRRASDNHGMTRPELSVLLSTAKMAMQDSIENASLANDPALEPELLAAFPDALVKKHKDALLTHRLRKEIIATKVANKMINRLGMLLPFELAEEEGCSLGNVAGAFVVADRLLGVSALWQAIDEGTMAEDCRLALYGEVATEMRAQMADILRHSVAGRSVADALLAYDPYIKELSKNRARLLPNEARIQTEAFGQRLLAKGAPEKIANDIVRLAQLDGATGLAALASAHKQPISEITTAFALLGDALGLGWAHGTAMQMDPNDPWERLLVAGLARDFQTMRLDFLRSQKSKNPAEGAKAWLLKNAERVTAFKNMIDRARTNASPSAAMLAQIAGQARALLNR